MRIRFLYFEIKDENNKQNIINFLSKNRATKITNLTFMFEDDSSIEDLCNELEESTNLGDKVIVLFQTEIGMVGRKIR